MFYKKTQGTKQLNAKVPKMEKFQEFQAGIWEGKTKTSQRKWVNTVSKKALQKVTNMYEFTITEKSCMKQRKERIVQY